MGFTYLIGCAIEAVPTAALAFHVLLGLTHKTWQAADRLRRLGTQPLKLHLWVSGIMRSKLVLMRSSEHECIRLQETKDARIQSGKLNVEGFLVLYF